MKTYEGNNVGGKRRVTVNGEPLSIKNHPEHDAFRDFSWGDQSQGSRNLAYSLLADAIDEDTALLLSDNFLESVVSKLSHDHWRLTDAEISKYCDRISSIRSSIPPDEWTDAGSGPTNVSRVAVKFSKIVADPNFHLNVGNKDS